MTNVFMTNIFMTNVPLWQMFLWQEYFYDKYIYDTNYWAIKTLFLIVYILNGIEDEVGADRVKELAAEGITAEYYGFDVTNDEAVTLNINKIGELNIFNHN